MSEHSDNDMPKDGVMTLENAFVNIPLARQHSFYISGYINDPQCYIPWFHIMRTAGEDDVIVLHINSPGGDVSTAIQFLRVMAECNATIVASVEGYCMSAATMIFLSADMYQVSEHSMFMFHNYSGGTIGKGGEMFDSITHERRWSKSLLEGCYKDFLNPEEIAAMLDGKDFWMDADDCIKRLDEREKKRQQAAADRELAEKKNQQEMTRREVAEKKPRASTKTKRGKANGK